MKKYIQVVYNASHGGFGVSKAGLKYIKSLAKDAGKTDEEIEDRYGSWDGVNICRHDRFLIKAVKFLKKKCNKHCAHLDIDKIPYKYKHKYECVVAGEDSNWESIKIDNSDEDGKNIFCKEMYYMPDPTEMTPEECKAKLLEIFALKEKHLCYEPRYDASDPETDSNKGIDSEDEEDDDEEDDDEEDDSEEDEDDSEEDW